MLFFHFIAALFTDAVIVVSYHVPRHHTLLNDLTREDGFYETATAICFAATAVFAVYVAARKSGYKFDKRQKIILFGVGALFSVAALEEISWGQRLLDYEAGPFFRSHNIQEEVNVHNLVPGVVFNTIIYAVIYAGFIIAPLVSMLCCQHGSAQVFSHIPEGMFSLNMVLLFLFGVSIHSYGAEHLIEHLGMAVQAACLLGVAYVMFTRQLGYGYERFNFVLLIVSIAVFWWHGDILLAERTGGGDELREFVLSYSFLYWLYGWCRRYRFDGRNGGAVVQ